MKKLLPLLFALVCSAFAQTPTVNTPLAAPGGRFVLGQLGIVRADQYLLDTQTGRLWVVRFEADVPVLQAVMFKTALGVSTATPPPAIAEIAPQKASADDYDAMAKEFEAEGKKVLAANFREEAAKMRAAEKK